MYSFLMAQNHTDLPTITISGADGVIFQDIPKGCSSVKRRVAPGSVRLEIYNNFMKLLTVVWVPLAPYESAVIVIYPDHVQLIVQPLP
ncbi:MAG: hypothetical protein IJ366_04710 [Clostridia bacterium]|nr:hypothetical protein [Clostridia bacterium]